MKNKINLILALSLSLLFLSACSRLPDKYRVIHNGTNDYQKAIALPPITVPPGYSSDHFHEAYPVPNPQLAGSKTPVSLLPPDISKDATSSQGQHWW